MSAVIAIWKAGASQASVIRRAIAFRMPVSWTTSTSPVGGRRRGRGRPAARPPLGALDVLGDDPALGAGPAEGGEVDAALPGDPARERRGLDAAAVLAPCGGLGRASGLAAASLGRGLGPRPLSAGSSASAASSASGSRPPPAPPRPTSSPGSPMTAIALPTSISSPSPARILRRTPDASASTSCVTFSVSSSYSGSPFSTWSPSDLSQRTIVPDSMPWPSRGSVTWLDKPEAWLLADGALDGGEHVLGVRDDVLLHDRRERDRRELGADALDGRVEVVEGARPGRRPRSPPRSPCGRPPRGRRRSGSSCARSRRSPPRRAAGACAGR